MDIHIHSHDKGILPKIGHQLVAFYDWLSGPPMSEHDRMNRELIVTEPIRNQGHQAL